MHSHTAVTLLRDRLRGELSVARLCWLPTATLASNITGGASPLKFALNRPADTQADCIRPLLLFHERGPQLEGTTALGAAGACQAIESSRSKCNSQQAKYVGLIVGQPK